jgi:hypothetical protein
MTTPSGINMKIPETFVGKAFKILDHENRGFLYKHEMLMHIKLGGVESHL